MMYRQRHLRLCARLAAGLLWPAAVAGIWLLPVRVAVVLSAAATCGTTWVLIATYDVRARVSEHERRLNAYGEGWAILHGDEDAKRRRAEMHSVPPVRRSAHKPAPSESSESA